MKKLTSTSTSEIGFVRSIADNPPCIEDYIHNLDYKVNELPDMDDCPFCGGKGVVVFCEGSNDESSRIYKAEHGYIHIENRYKAGCPVCGIYTESIKSDIFIDMKGNVYIKNGALLAIKKWNRRSKLGSRIGEGAEADEG